MRKKLLIAFPLLWCLGSSPGAADQKPNVLFIAIDDLRPELGAYGAEHMHTPHMDKLAAQGLLFEKAYVNSPVCGASRASLMTGLYPNPKHNTAWNARADKLHPGVVTLPEYFKNQGYHTVSLGKMMHHQDDSPQAWSEPAWRATGNRGAGVHIYNEEGVWANPDSKELTAPWPQAGEGKLKGPYAESADVPDEAYHDGQLTQKAIEDLKRLAKADKPFFLACGFWRPHLPFNAPKKYWDLYDRDAIELADNRKRPKGAPGALQGSGEIKQQYSDNNGFPGNDDFHRRARHGYYACVSYIDAQVGELVNALDELGLAKNTIIVLWSDHGFHLGEHNFWGKHNTMDLSVRSPLIIRTPAAEARRVGQVVEFIDIYPTLAELAALPVPDHCQGKSMVPIFADSGREHKEAVFVVWRNSLAVKTEHFLYTEWGTGEPRMLYDHRTDPQENENVAGVQSYEETVKAHGAKLQEFRESFR